MVVNKVKILFCITTQFGYHTDTYMYCKYLDKSKYNIHYVGFDCNYPHKTVENVFIHYVPVNNNIFLNYYNYLKSVNKIIKKEKFDLIFYVDCQITLLLRILNLRTHSILDIRTGDIHFNGCFSFFNIKILVTSVFFKNVTVISHELQKFLKIPSKKCHILPLGGEPMDLPKKSFDTLNLFYIGTLIDRNIHLTIDGIAIFKRKYPDVIIKYDIVGGGNSQNIDLINRYIAMHNLQDFVKYHGYLDHDNAKELFTKANVGVVFVPLSKGYYYQPSTKLYEFLLVGIPVIATRTIDNINMISEKEGILIDDSPISFANGLEILHSRKSNYDLDFIKNKFALYSWSHIVKRNLEQYFYDLFV